MLVRPASVRLCLPAYPAGGARPVISIQLSMPALAGAHIPPWPCCVAFLADRKTLDLTASRGEISDPVASDGVTAAQAVRLPADLSGMCEWSVLRGRTFAGEVPIPWCVPDRPESSFRQNTSAVPLPAPRHILPAPPCRQSLSTPATIPTNKSYHSGTAATQRLCNKSVKSAPRHCICPECSCLPVPCLPPPRRRHQCLLRHCRRNFLFCPGIETYLPNDYPSKKDANVAGHADNVTALPQLRLSYQTKRQDATSTEGRPVQ